ncbi:hypothetical protein [Peribacillus frigoritolerans]|uniref:hypothetical protein n=1 Tax=Peribacillus frigoritolerans TaxID=450367 RepID=UPI00215AB2EC|nr:hypothetical protein [Peribacillus frigoritolerans]MCR8869375.1 hypothetical protein [Peribacillus frigoritolerans]
MKRLLGICISMQMTFVLLFITGITPKLNSYVGATIYLIIGFASLVISLYLAGKKFLLGISFIAFYLFLAYHLFHHFHLFLA